MALLTIVLFFALLLILVLVHEFGHFLVARWAGCRVQEFGFGFPPRIASIKWGDTVYSFNLLPIGGFVKIEGEDMQTSNPPPTDFASKSATWRIAILSAGVAMNVLLAAVLLMFQAGVGFPTLVTEENKATLENLKTYIVDVAPASPAEEAGLKPLDRLVRLGDVENPTIEEIQRITQAQSGQPIPIEIERAGAHQTLTVTPRPNPPPGEGALGVGLSATGLHKVPWWQAPWAGIKRTGEMFVAIFVQFTAIVRQLMAGEGVGTALTGPIGIAVYTGEAVRLGISYVLEFAALISLNLAIINILPLPALDGGRIAFVLAEKVAGRRLPARFEHVVHTVGFALLITLMLFITYTDIRRYF
jgi:regulator of sigma E protease